MENTIAEILEYFKIPKFNARIRFAYNRNPYSGENALSIEIANYLKVATIEKRLNATWTKIAHETSSRSYTYGVLMRNMGKNPGCADFIFSNGTTHLWMELKAHAKSKFQPSQVFFKNWCNETGSNYVVVTSLKEAITALEKFKLLDPQKHGVVDT